MQEPSAELDRLASAVINAALEVHKILGAGFLESTYEQALAIEFRLRGTEFEEQKPISLEYKNCPVGQTRLDFLVRGMLVVELKAVDTLLPVHHAQVSNYLKATGCQLGLLINFNVPLLRDGLKRIVLT